MDPPEFPPARPPVRGVRGAAAPWENLQGKAKVDTPWVRTP